MYFNIRQFFNKTWNNTDRMRLFLILFTRSLISKLSKKAPTHRSWDLSSRHIETIWWVNPLKKSGCNFFSIGIPYEETCPDLGKEFLLQIRISSLIYFISDNVIYCAACGTVLKF